MESLVCDDCVAIIAGEDAVGKERVAGKTFRILPARMIDHVLAQTRKIWESQWLRRAKAADQRQRQHGRRLRLCLRQLLSHRTWVWVNYDASPTATTSSS